MLEPVLRLLRHRWLDDGLRRAMTPEILARIEARVAASERRHSGEIRFCIEAGLPNSYIWRGATARDRAVAMFSKLGVWDTEQNNGVLIYVLLVEHPIEIVPARGVARHVDPGAWNEVVAHMAQAFREGRFEDGLTHALEEVSALLVRHYPVEAGRDNPDELPNTPHLG